MKIYRYVTQEELDMMKEKSPELGKTYGNDQLNDFRYKEGVKYLHFFKKKKSIKYIKELYKGKNNTFYVCTFNVPFSTLMFHSACGYYYDREKKDCTHVKEYAIYAKKFQPEWIEEVEKDRDKEE